MASAPERSLAVVELNEAMRRASATNATKTDLLDFREALRELDRAVIGRRIHSLKLKPLGELHSSAVNTVLLQFGSAIQYWEDGQPTSHVMRRLLSELRLLCLSQPAATSAALQPQGER
jgi:hypothetical protein